MSYNPNFTQRQRKNNTLAHIVRNQPTLENNTNCNQHYIEVIIDNGKYYVGYTCIHNSDMITMETASVHDTYQSALQAAIAIATN